ncbi:MAG: response regulator [Candidatus Omnitrophota bacterium]|nr:response regulator [Candidatus Omnitrophota bacterium]
MKREKAILIIEQEINLANGLKVILEKEDYQVISAYSLYAIKDILEDKEPDLVIINISIPKELGLNILRKIKKRFPSVPIIAMSVYTNSFSGKELKRFGADDFIAKPFDVNNLKQKIGQLLGKRREIKK